MITLGITVSPSMTKPWWMKITYEITVGNLERGNQMKALWFFFLTTLINIRKIEEVQILVLVPIHFQYVCFKWPNSFSNSDNRVKAWYVYSIRFCILNNNLASIKWKLAIDFHVIFLLLFPIDCLTFKGFQSFFSKISLHKILKVKSFHVFFTCYFSNLFF